MCCAIALVEVISSVHCLQLGLGFPHMGDTVSIVGGVPMTVLGCNIPFLMYVRFPFL